MIVQVEQVLEVLHAQGSKLITLEVLKANCYPVESWRDDEGTYPNVVLQNGVRWFYDKTRRPKNKAGHDIKAIAPAGDRALLGDLSEDGAKDVVLFEGERDWLTGLSLGLRAICAGGANNLTDFQLTLFKGKRQVSIAFDNDEAGIAAGRRLAAQIARDGGVKTVLLCTIPLAGADFSEWAEMLPENDRANAVHTLVSRGEKIGKREAKKLLKEAKEDADKPVPSDEFVTPDGDPVVLIGELADPSRPFDQKQPLRVRFLRYDRETSKKSGMLVTEVLDEYRRDTPEEIAQDAPEMYAPKPHLIEQPAVLKPLDDPMFYKRVFMLPSGADEHGKSETLYSDVYAFIDRYFEIDESFLHAATAYVLLSYRYHDANFEVVPYLRITGEGGQGKTRFLRIMRELCHRTIYMAGVRPVHLYRILESLKSGATMIIEEMNFQERTEEGRVFTDMLNIGNQRDALIPRLFVGQSSKKMEWLPVFCTKVFSTKDDFIDTGLLRRCITAQAGGREVPKSKQFDQLPDEFYLAGQELRRRLLGWRFAKFEQQRPDPLERPDVISMGLWQTWRPVLSMVPEAHAAARDAILSMALGGQNTLDLILRSGSDAQVIVAMLNCAEWKSPTHCRPYEHPRAWLPKVLVELSTQDPNTRWKLVEVRDAARRMQLTLKRSKRTDDAGEITNDYYVDLDAAFRAAVARRRFDIDLSVLDKGAPAEQKTIM